MTSRVSWSVEGIEPSVRDRAEAAARRAGMSLNDWLNSTIGDATPARRPSADVDDIHNRLDTIARQIEQAGMDDIAATFEELEKLSGSSAGRTPGEE